jgi:hypothetical protein
VKDSASVKLDCGHKFHLKCYMNLQMSNGSNKRKCPNCRKEQDIPDVNRRRTVRNRVRRPILRRRNAVIFPNQVDELTLAEINSLIAVMEGVDINQEDDNILLVVPPVRPAVVRSPAEPILLNRLSGLSLRERVLGKSSMGHSYTLDRMMRKLARDNRMIFKNELRSVMNRLVICGNFRKERNMVDGRKYNYVRVR